MKILTLCLWYASLLIKTVVFLRRARVTPSITIKYHGSDAYLTRLCIRTTAAKGNLAFYKKKIRFNYKTGSGLLRREKQNVKLIAKIFGQFLSLHFPRRLGSFHNLWSLLIEINKNCISRWNPVSTYEIPCILEVTVEFPVSFGENKRVKVNPEVSLG